MRHPRFWLITPFMIGLVVASAVHAEDAKQLPIVFRDDFEKGAERWQPSDPQMWKVKETPEGHVYSQFDRTVTFKPPHRSPYNISLLQGVTVSDFTLDVKVKSTYMDYDHRDVCIVFGYQDPAHFYYVHLGKKADDHANQIFIVNDQPRTKISITSTAGTNWDDQWHHVRIVRNVGDGTIRVFFDEMKEPIMTAKDRTFAYGRIGLGTFDDTSDWDDLELRGVKVEGRSK